MPTRRLLPALALCAALALAACGGDDGDAGPSGTGPAVVATTTQVADLARQVAGDRADVTRLLDPEADPHDYEPRPSDARAVAGADVVLRSGGDLDEWLGDVLASAGSDAESITLLDAVRPRPEAGDADPHWWQDPRNAMTAVERIRDALAAGDPGGRAVYAANAEAYTRRLRTLDAAIARCVAAIPERDRRLVTDHDALGPFAARYGIEVVGTVIPALSTQAQPSAGAVLRLVRAIRREGVATIFPSSSVSARLARAIARESGAQVGPALYADTLGPEGSPGATYLGALRANARAIVAGLGAEGCALPG